MFNNCHGLQSFIAQNYNCKLLFKLYFFYFHSFIQKRSKLVHLPLQVYSSSLIFVGKARSQRFKCINGKGSTQVGSRLAYKYNTK